MKRQFDFVNQVNATVDKAHKAIKNIRKINKKLSNFEENYGDLEETQALLSQVKELKKKFSEVEKALYQTKNRSNQDPLNFPIRLTNKLGHLNRLVTINDFPPTDQDEAVRSYLTSEVEKHLSIYQQMIDQDLEDFNTAFAKLNLDYLTVN
jgi:DNA repair ATPase RecN